MKRYSVLIGSIIVWILAGIAQGETSWDAVIALTIVAVLQAIGDISDGLNEQLPS